MQPSQSFTVYVWNTPIHIAATMLLSVVLCGVLAPSDFHVFGPQMKHLGGHRLQNVAKVQEAMLQKAQNSMLKVYIH